MARNRSIVWALVLACGVFDCAAETHRHSIPIDEARRELGLVAAYQNFPQKCRIDRYGTLEAEEVFYHIFLTQLPRSYRWRTLVFSNSGDYLGYYETADPPAATEKDALIYPGPSGSSLYGDFVEDKFDLGDAYIVRFSAAGPPDEIKFAEQTFVFISSPRRIRPDDPAYRFNQLANRVADMINRSRYKAVREDFSKEALARVSEEQTIAILESLRKRFGKVERVGVPWVQSENTAVLPVTFERAVAGLKLILSEDNKITGLWVLPFKTAFPDIGKNATPMRLPVKNKWRVMWGGDQRNQSKYFGSQVSHHALELVISDRFNITYRNEGKQNEDYFAFGQPVVAPAAGTVVAIIDGVEDNHPHSPNPIDRLGNAIMIEHSPNEYSVVGHLMENSISVRVGERVVAGLPIAKCGNSGDSSQPSVYYHLQDSARLLAGSGYKPYFSNLHVWKGDQADIVPTHSPVRGEFVLQASEVQKAGAAR
ncbi:peptidoglycan DD-metalloendopeptidase family protein [Pontiellaceae bacterium B1224]|nr:peptidoglycan DD-metalloendopeptidase family protein [Pontiellaceae bacterium B1224]